MCDFVPAIDLYQGKAVYQRSGRVTASLDAKKYARRFEGFCEVQVIDLEAVTGEGENQGLVRALCRKLAARVGGGIRSVSAAQTALACGARRVIVGTKATPSFLRRLASLVPAQKIVVSLDVDGENVLTHGRTRARPWRLEKRLQRLAPWCGEFLLTSVKREGSLAGFDAGLLERALAASPRPLSLAGGIATPQQILALNRLSVKPVVGMALAWQATAKQIKAPCRKKWVTR